jgi:hypothetical protein
LEDAAAEAARQAQLQSFRVIRYERPLTLFSLVTGQQSSATSDVGRLAGIFSPRLWDLTPGAELSALTSALGRE